MKIISRLAIIASVLSMGTSFAYSHGGSCNLDVYQMNLEIYKYGTITTHQGDQMNEVSTPYQIENSCYAQAYLYGYFRCQLKWEMGNWGDTFVCI